MVDYKLLYGQMKKTDKKLREHIAQFLGRFDNIKRSGLQQTPKRFVRAWEELLSGYVDNPSKYIKIFNEGIDQIICLRNISFVSTCEHHGLTFNGYIHIAYIPKSGRIIGISKLGRIVDAVSKKLQIQERVVKEIADVLEKQLKPVGVLVIGEASHLCMTIRGIKKQNAVMITSEARGVFRRDGAARMEALTLLFNTKWNNF